MSALLLTPSYSDITYGEPPLVPLVWSDDGANRRAELQSKFLNPNHCDVMRFFVHRESGYKDLPEDVIQLDLGMDTEELQGGDSIDLQ